MIAGPPEINVATLNRSISQLMTQHLPRRYYVRGEYLNVSSSQAGHVYFQLKDTEEDSLIACIIYRSCVREAYLQIAEGTYVIALGTLRLYPPAGTYQLQVEFILERGLGQSQLSRQALRRKLADEGLFDPERKRPLPLFPRRVGLITSESGAALQDFLSTLKHHNFSGQVILFPSPVQGVHALPTLEVAIKLANTLTLDVLVITRGGGPSEDLSVFNEESLTRLAAASQAPFISAIGHAVDSTFLDAVADLSFVTPTASAQALACRQADTAQHFKRLCLALERVASHRVEKLASTLKARAERLKALRATYHARCLARFESMVQTLRFALIRRVDRHRSSLGLTARLLRDTSSVYLSRHGARLRQAKQRLEAMRVDKILRRGFVLAEDDQGRPLESATEVMALSSFSLRFKDVRVRVKALEP